jgi:hypothetical protein
MSRKREEQRDGYARREYWEARMWLEEQRVKLELKRKTPTTNRERLEIKLEIGRVPRALSITLLSMVESNVNSGYGAVEAFADVLFGLKRDCDAAQAALLFAGRLKIPDDAMADRTRFVEWLDDCPLLPRPLVAVTAS